MIGKKAYILPQQTLLDVMLKRKPCVYLLFLFFISLFAFDFAFALPSATFVSPTASDNITATSNWTYINITSSENLTQALLEWGNQSGIANVSMTNSSGGNLTWRVNMTSLTDRTYNYTIWMQNATGNWSQSARKWITIDTVAPYNLSACQNISVVGGSYILVKNVASAGTCFSINANSIILNGSGYLVSYSQSIAGYAINASGVNTVTIKNLSIAQGNSSVSGAYAIYFNGMSSGTLTNNTITTSGNTSHGIYLLSSDANTFTNNTVLVSGINSSAFVLNSSASNSIIGGSLFSRASYDYFLQSAGALNNFTNTNFTAKRGIYFADATSYFNYNNQTSGSIWLKAKISSMGYINRTLVNWNNTLLKWNDTNSTSGVSADYVLGLLPNVSYSIYNTSAGTQSNSYNLTTDAAGLLSGISVALGGNTEILVSKGAPIISSVSPANGTSLASGTTSVSASIATTENATCRYNLTNSSFAYLQGTLMSTNDNVSHSFTYSSLADGQTYSIYYKCNDTYGNTNIQSTYHTFSVSNPTPVQTPITSTSNSGSNGPTITKSISAVPNDVVSKLAVNFNTKLTGPYVRASKLYEVPVDAPQNPVYHYINITKAKFNDSDILNATMEFKVNKSWIFKNNISKVSLLRYVDGWVKLDTELIESADDFNLYVAHPTGFSYFAIVGEKQVVQNAQTPVQNEPSGEKTKTIQENVPVENTDSTSLQNNWWTALVTIKDWSFYGWILFLIALYLAAKIGAYLLRMYAKSSRRRK